MKIILFMTLSGSMLFLMLKLIEFLKIKAFNIQQKYKIFKIALLIHFIPLPMFVFCMKTIFLKWFPLKPINNFAYYQYEKLLIITNERLEWTSSFFNEFFIFAIWIVVAVLILLFQIFKHQKFRNLTLKASNEITDFFILNIVDEYRTKLGIKRNISIYQTGADISPFTIGILKPIIVIPHIDDRFRIKTAIYHELCHIKNNDGLVLLLRVFMRCIYWFNPVTYFLNKELENSCELVCDEKVTQDMNRNDRLQYGYFIIDISTRKTNKKYVSAFSNDKDIIKERLDCIMNPRKKSKKLAVVIAGILCFVSIVPAFAYDMPKILNVENKNNYDLSLKSDGDFMKFVPEGQEDSDSINKVLHRSAFISDDGKIYDINEESETKLFCNHSYVNGTYQKHIKNSNGGCTIYYYNAKLCSKCGNMILGDIINEITFKKCTH